MTHPSQTQSKLLQAESQQLFPLQCPNCQQLNTVTRKPYRDIPMLGLIFQKILSNKVSRNLLAYTQALILMLATFIYFNRFPLAFRSRNHLEILPQNPLEWSGVLVIGLNIVYIAWNGIRNGVTFGYKYNCINCKYKWEQVKPDPKMLIKNFKAAARNLPLARKIGSKTELALALNSLAVYKGIVANDWQTALSLAQESLPLAQASGDNLVVQTLCYNTLGFSLLHIEQKITQAVPPLQQSLTLARANRQWQLYPSVINTLAAALAYQGEYESARQHFEESLVYRLKMGGIETELVVDNLEGLALVASGYGFPARATRLAGAAKARRSIIGIPLPQVDQQHINQMLEQTRSQLGQADFEKAWSEGLAMPLVPAVHYALSNQA
jgi:tetratricopeptide (TPR) repeat protein